ncbi:GAF domain-containing protein [Synechococcus moorigangaii CMS01]|nr:GAF domain-containing protein [Synechococcus moorigangaii CMS01]
MILNAITPDISWIAPWSVLQQLCHLWRRLGIGTGTDPRDRLYLSGAQLQEVGLALEDDIFHLLVETDFVALLWANALGTAESPSAEPGGQYQISLVFNPQAIAPLIQTLCDRPIDLPQLVALKKKTLPERSAIPPDLLLGLLEVVRSPSFPDNVPDEVTLPNQPLNTLLSQRLEQEKILNNVTHRIYQNQDLLVTVRMALEQAQRLLRVDRLLVYQLDLPAADPGQWTNRVTFEVTSSPKVTSLLNFDQDDCLTNNQLIKDAYRNGRQLAVNDVETDPHLSPCFKTQLQEMQVKAKLVVPLIVEQRLWGLLIAHQCHGPRRWRKNEITFLTHVAEYLAIAILQARSYQQIQAQKTSLETLAQQRARELEDALLSAQVASQSKKEFIHIMSHELLTPLTSIIGLSNTLSYWTTSNNPKKLSLEKQQAYLRTIHESGTRLRNLLQDILDFSQTEAARVVLDLQQFSLKQLCHRVSSDFQEFGDRQGVTLKFVNQLEPEQDSFYADPLRLEKILSHLLSNAIKFTSHGGEVTLTLWREQQKDAVFQVKDTGIGIPPQQIPLLFEQFQQLEPSMSRHYDGAGFGLALVKQLVEIHQGQINVTSKPKKGSTFTVRIPNQIPRNLHPTSPGNLGGNQGGTVVLVSQDEEMATLICELLTATNYQVIWLIDGEIASRQISTLQPVIVLLDAHQQGFPFEDIIDSLKITPQTQQIPVLLIGDRPDSKAQPQPVGFQDYLPKPIQSEQLIDMVNHYVTRHYLDTNHFPTAP